MLSLWSDSSPWKEVFCWKLGFLRGLAWGRGKPESSSSPVAVQSNFSPSPRPHVVDLPGPAHLFSLCSPHWHWEPSCRREDFLGKRVLQDQALHVLCLALCSAYFLLGAWFLPLFQQHRSLLKAAHSAVAVGGMDWWECGMAKAFGWLAFSTISLCALCLAKGWLLWRVLSTSWEELRGRKLGKTQ